MRQSPTIAASPRHLLFLVDELCEMGGAERMLLNTIRLLPKEKFRCTLITFRIDPSLNIFDNLPCPFHLYPLRRTYDWNALRVAAKLRAFIRKENVEIVHTFFETADLWAGLIAKISGVRVLISSRRDMGILRSRKHDLGYRFMNPFFDLVLTVSEEVRRFCIQQDHRDPETTVTLYNGLELDGAGNASGQENLQSLLGFSPPARSVVTLGHIRKVKGIDILVETAARVAKEFPDAVFLVIGRNSEPDHVRELEARISELGIQRNVRFLGEVKDATNILKSCGIFFLPSRSEGFSNALIEAMACGLPCVATRVGGNPEAIDEGKSGFLIENEDVEAGADRILKLLHDSTLAKQMGDAGRKIVEARFTSKVMIQELVSHYERLLANKGITSI